MPSKNIWVQVHREVRVSPLGVSGRDANKADWDVRPLIKTFTVHDDVDRSILETFLRCTSISDREVRMQALRMFHEAQLARWSGGTIPIRLGYQLQEFLDFYTQQEVRAGDAPAQKMKSPTSGGSDEAIIRRIGDQS